ncbi:Mid1p KNAG_0K02310 [Huiozyma naganishii CBS 8797]|uniref:FZ domain-containing protein n=1 Tax=Huiozyma naganishii (strain ATCC MYA-139 / BCRC 22969 / CBS 8797 / KCTC 17520 / NBRC 10181 / NCYC 3082 / Yp74L-3) TaxID=1071383 RepID=J7SAA7_HUIN7|nr:hypothetical protein KNAG_0K02310 [Kazachstania naganishii CBS 8797]CCK72594.1 hypothetical protein KNAG_0K02310 [Kazachstania naganishii CBS 8797]
MWSALWLLCGLVFSAVHSWGVPRFDFDRYGALRSSTSIINSDNIAEWTPIVSELTPGKQDFYMFNISDKSSGLGFAPSYEILIFMSGNICSQPPFENASFNSLEVEVRLSYAFNDTIAVNASIGESVAFSSGYVEALEVCPLNVTDQTAFTKSQFSNLYVVVELYNTTSKLPLQVTPETAQMTWSYRLSISENDLVFQWDERSWLEVLDTDHNSALLMTGNVSADHHSQMGNVSVYDPSLYDIYIYTEEESTKLMQAQMNFSLCAVTNGNYLVTSANEVNVSSNMMENTLRVQKTIASSGNGVSEFFYVTGLNMSTSYVAYLTKKIGQRGNLSDVGGILFSNIEFTTAIDDSCSLIYGLDFCTDVMYSVPTSSLAAGNKTLMAETYDNIAKGVYANFSSALKLVSCDTELDARYSPLRTCEDCARSYRDWLCAVSIPRCTTRHSEYYLMRSKNDNRNAFINEYIRPIRNYYEILPCINMCYNLVSDCPSVFGFSCPSSNKNEELLLNSYNYFIEDSWDPTCNFLGNITHALKS